MTEAERAKVLNALRTWGEVITFMQARSRPLPPEVVDLDVFLHEGTPAPCYPITALADQAGEGGSGVGHAHAACGTGASGRAQRAGTGDAAEDGAADGGALHAGR